MRIARWCWSAGAMKLMMGSDRLIYLSTFTHFVCLFYVAAKATYIRLLHGKISFLGGFSALAP